MSDVIFSCRFAKNHNMSCKVITASLLVLLTHAASAGFPGVASVFLLTCAATCQWLNQTQGFSLLQLLTLTVALK